MKNTFYTITLAALAMLGCKNADTAATAHEEALETEEVMKANEDAQLFGEISKEDLKEVDYNSWYKSHYNELEADEEVISEIENHIHDYEIVAFMGTWCSDSQREIPQLFNLLEQVNYDESKVKLFAVNEDKETVDNKEEEYNVAYVPTIIFIKDGKEANRFVEFAQESLARDILKIVKGEDYTNPYAE